MFLVRSGRSFRAAGPRRPWGLLASRAHGGGSENASPLPQVSPPLPEPLESLAPLNPLEPLDPLQQHQGDTETPEPHKEVRQAAQEDQVVQEDQEAQVVIREDVHPRGHPPRPAGRESLVQDHAPEGIASAHHTAGNGTDPRPCGRNRGGWTYPRPTLRRSTMPDDLGPLLKA